MKLKVGLTGSIGMGKSTTAAMFADAGCAVWDADAAVHRLYAPGGAAVAPLAEAFPEAVVDNAVSRPNLRQILSSDKTAMQKLEQIVHPLVQRDRDAFVKAHPDRIGVFDIPLLFETGADAEMDVTVCVHVAPEIQRARVLARNTMSNEDLDRILARQMPSDEKCARATYVIDTDTLEHTRAQVQTVMDQLSERIRNA